MNALHRKSQVDRLARMAWAALLVLALGAGSHLWHHLTDSDCDKPLRGGHACSMCAAFHGGVLAGHADLAVTPPPQAPSSISLPAVGHVVTLARPVGSTRGPPTA